MKKWRKGVSELGVGACKDHVGLEVWGRERVERGV